MRKCFPMAVALCAFAVMLAPAAKAGTVSLSINNVTPSTTTFTISGTYSSNVPVTNISTPNGSYAITFTLLTNPSSLSSFQSYADNISGGVNQGGFFTVNAAFSMTVNGGASISLGTLNVEFDDTVGGNGGGLIFCVDGNACGTYWDIIGQQLFTGSVSNPTFITTANAQVNETMSGYGINGSVQFPFGPSPTPEPASLFLLGTGLLGVGILVRKKTKVA